MFLPHTRVKVSIVGSLRDREVACSASDRQGSNFESCVWRTVSSQSSHHPQEVLLAQFSLYVHKGGLKPDSFYSFSRCIKASFYTPGNKLNFPTSKGFRTKFSMKLVYQYTYMSIFLIFKPHQVIFIHYKRLVVDEDGKFRLERVTALKYVCINHGDHGFFQPPDHDYCRF